MGSSPMMRSEVMRCDAMRCNSRFAYGTIRSGPNLSKCGEEEWVPQRVVMCVVVFEYKLSSDLVRVLSRLRH